MKTIWKFTLFIGPTTVEIPQFAEILCVQFQNAHPQIWALVDSDAPIVKRVFEIFGTGHPVPEHYSFSDYVGTVQDMDGLLVWHVFEGRKP